MYNNIYIHHYPSISGHSGGDPASSFRMIYCMLLLGLSSFHTLWCLTTQLKSTIDHDIV